MRIHNELSATAGHLEDCEIQSLGIKIRPKRFSALRNASHHKLGRLKDSVESLCSPVY